MSESILANHPSPPDAASLDVRIAAAEARLLERQARLRSELHAVSAQVRRAVTPQRLALPAIGALLLWGVWRVVRPRRKRLAPHPQMGAALLFPQLAAMLWPLLTRVWRERAFPAGLATTARTGERSGAEARSGSRLPHPVSGVDLQRYAGTWYEVARYRNRFEDHCAGQPSATYLPRGDHIEVVNRCTERDHTERVAHGVAREVRGSHGAQLKVSFAPRWLRALPFVWADYWVLHLESDYSAALVGTPDRRYLWLLARERALPEALMLRMLDAADAQGFDLQKLTLSHPAYRAAAAQDDGQLATPPTVDTAATANPVDTR